MNIVIELYGLGKNSFCLDSDGYDFLWSDWEDKSVYISFMFIQEYGVVYES